MAGPGDPISHPHSQDDSAVDWDTEIKKLLAKGEDLMAKELYKKGIPTFLNAVNMCKCNPAADGKPRHGKDKSCNILQCTTAVRSRNYDKLYQVANSPCTCGYEWPSCTRSLHLQALDGLAKCLEKADQYVSAFSTALSVIRLDPASAAGYCRAATILRYLLKNSKRSDQCVNSSLSVVLRHANLASVDLLPDLVKSFVKNGLYNSEHHRHRPSDTYYLLLCRIAHKMKLEEALRDPVKNLPHEVLSMIFSMLEFKHRIRCLRVNKQWNQVMLRDSRLWSDLRLRRPKGNPGRFFSDFLQKHQHIRSLVIRDTASFVVTTTKLHNIFYGLPRLKRLGLRFTSHSLSQQLLNFGIPGRTGARLTHLSLDAFFDLPVVKSLLELTRDTLEVLDLKNTVGRVNDTIGHIPFPKLKKLRITSTCTQVPVVVIGMEPLVIATPNLEQFYLDGFMVTWPQSPDNPNPTKTGLWPHLREIVLGPHLACPPMDSPPPMRGRILPPFTPNLRSIEILCPAPLIAHHVLFVADPPPEPGLPAWTFPPIKYPDLPNLEVFRCMTAIEPGHLHAVLESAAKSGSLKVLELTIESTLASPPDLRLRQLLGTVHVRQPATEFDFARSENIHTLGLHNFNWASDSGSSSIAPGFDGQPFLDWLDCFPNLHTVAAYPGWHDNVARFFAKLVDHPRVKVIHQESLRSAADYPPMKDFATKRGVKLHLTKKFYKPPGWDDSDEDED